MSWENLLAGAHLIENLLNLFSRGISYSICGKWNVSIKRRRKAEISHCENQKQWIFSLIVLERGRRISVKLGVPFEFTALTAHCGSMIIHPKFKKPSRKSCFKVNFWGEQGERAVWLLFLLFSSRLFTQVWGHTFITRILSLALRQSTQGWGRTTSVLTPRRIWTPGSGLWTRLLSCRHAPHWRGKFLSEALKKI